MTSGVAIQTSGAGIIFAFIVSGFAALLSGLCYAEYAARIPGKLLFFLFLFFAHLRSLWISVHLCLHHFGRALWLAVRAPFSVLKSLLTTLSIGWNMTLEYAVAASAVAQGWAGYFSQMMASIGAPLPSWLSGFELWGPFSLTYLLYLSNLCSLRGLTPS